MSSIITMSVVELMPSAPAVPRLLSAYYSARLLVQLGRVVPLALRLASEF
jgi:hypothetical protein